MRIILEYKMFDILKNENNVKFLIKLKKIIQIYIQNF